jgi:hypothetical protein
MKEDNNTMPPKWRKGVNGNGIGVSSHELRYFAYFVIFVTNCLPLTRVSMASLLLVPLIQQSLTFATRATPQIIAIPHMRPPPLSNLWHLHELISYNLVLIATSSHDFFVDQHW